VEAMRVWPPSRPIQSANRYITPAHGRPEVACLHQPPLPSRGFGTK
jgi:hypothetical protein